MRFAVSFVSRSILEMRFVNLSLLRSKEPDTEPDTIPSGRSFSYYATMLVGVVRRKKKIWIGGEGNL